MDKMPRDQNQWGNNSFELYAQMSDKTEFRSINKKIINVKQDSGVGRWEEILRRKLSSTYERLAPRNNLKTVLRPEGLSNMYGYSGWSVCLYCFWPVSILWTWALRAWESDQRSGIRSNWSDRSQLIRQLFEVIDCRGYWHLGFRVYCCACCRGLTGLHPTNIFSIPDVNRSLDHINWIILFHIHG